MRYSQTTLKKLEELLEELGYNVRYEKGNFNSGYCIVENRKIAVVNKFFDTEARCTSLVEILHQFHDEQPALTEKSAELFQKIRQQRSAETQN